VQPAVVAGTREAAPEDFARAGSRSTGRAPFVALVAALVGTATITWSASPLAYDGAAILLRTVHHRSPFVTHDRVITALVKWPTAAAVWLTDSMGIARVTFSLSYALLPVIAAVLAWLVVRRHAPHLGVWAAIGIFVVTMPGLVFAVSEAETVVQFTWPLLLLTLIGLRTRAQWAGAILLAAAIVTMHPFAVALLAMVAGVAWIGALTGRVARRPMLLWGAALMTAALVRWSAFDPYERAQSNTDTLRTSFRTAVSGAPLVALVLALAAGAAIVVFRRIDAPRAVAAVCIAGPLAGTVVALGWWAAGTERWQDASAYRGWVLAASLPFFVLAIADARLPARSWARVAPRVMPALGAAGVMAACAFALTSTLQGIGWHRLTNNLEQNLSRASKVCTTRAEVIPSPPAALHHWATASLAIVVQGRDPRHILLADRAACTAFERGAVPAVVGHGRVIEGEGWVRLPSPDGPTTRAIERP
jgi:hypothetical protein